MGLLFRLPAPAKSPATEALRHVRRVMLLAALLVAPLSARAITAGAATQPDRYGSTALVAGTSSGAILRADSGQNWRSVANLGGNGVQAIAAARDGRTLYAATTSNLWRSRDGGAHWSTVSDPDTRSAVFELAVDPGDANVVYAGTDATLSQSTDGGASWVVLNNGLPQGSSVESVAVDSHNPASVWAGYASQGLYHSTDGGSTWSSAGDVFSSATVQAIAVSPATGDVVYVGTDSGLYQSIDGGNTWSALSGITPDAQGVKALAISPRNPSRVYAATYSTIDYSSDGGATWTSNSGDLQSAGAVNALLADPSNPLAAYAGTANDIMGTTDGGATWHDLSGGDLGYQTNVTALALATIVHTPVDPVGPACCGAQYFPQKQHNLAGPFLAFYRRYGGLDIFGYPRTEQFVENGVWKQYTERFLLEHVAGRVIVAPLGRVLTLGRRFPRLMPFPSTSSRLYFSSTGHSLSGAILSFWRRHHGSILLGAPIAEPDREMNGDGTGRTYMIQWFENGRLEYHPELAGTRYVVEIGLAGKQDLQCRGWLS